MLKVPRAKRFGKQFKMDANASKFRQVVTGTMVASNPNHGQIGFMAGDAALAKKSACLLANRVIVIFILAMKQMIKFILITLRFRMKEVL